MQMPHAPLTREKFYDALPPADHRTGDIWRHLPTFNLLGRTSAPGIVITPACDLANRKCETITYLPILPADDYLASPAFRYDCWLEMLPTLQRLADFGAVLAPGRFDLIAESELAHLIGQGKDVNGKMLPAADMAKLAAYQKYVEASRTGKANVSHLKAFIKAEKFRKLLDSLVSNSLKPDLHFLPKDGQPEAYSAVFTHSLILFRYPLTIPIEILHLSQESTNIQWQAHRENSTGAYPTLTYMSHYPIKLASLKGEFLSDMISRYVNMYIRLGATDFSEESVRSMAEEIGA
jgi:hypothetical protein